jgi:hypothetical protein
VIVREAGARKCEDPAEIVGEREAMPFDENGGTVQTLLAGLQRLSAGGRASLQSFEQFGPGVLTHRWFADRLQRDSAVSVAAALALGICRGV